MKSPQMRNYIFLLTISIFFVSACNAAPVEPTPTKAHTPSKPTITTTRTSTTTQIPASITPQPTEIIIVACAKADVNIRPIPSINEERVGILTYKTCKQILGFNEDKSWAQIEEGWVKYEFLELAEEPNAIISPTHTVLTNTPSITLITQTKTPTKKITQTRIPTKRPAPTKTIQIITQEKLLDIIYVFEMTGFNFSSHVDNLGLTCYEGNNRSDNGDAEIILCGDQNLIHGGTLLLNTKDDSKKNAYFISIFFQGMFKGWKDGLPWLMNALAEIDDAHKKGVPIHVVEYYYSGYHIFIVGNNQTNQLGLLIEDDKYASQKK